MARIIAAATIAAVIATAGAATASAELSAEDAHGYRESVMTALRGHIGAASMIVRGIVEDDGHLLYHAEAMASGAREIHRVFQEGSNVGDSEALPVIWEEPEKFAAAIAKAEEATENFKDVVAAGGDRAEIGAAFRELGMSCRGCHDDFRVPR